MDRYSEDLFAAKGLQVSNLLSDRQAPSLLDEFLSSAMHSGVQAPAEGVAQLVDRVAGTKWQENVHFQDAPAERAFLSSHWVAQQTGAAAGMQPWFLALHKGSSCLLQRTPLAPEALKLAARGEALTARQTFQLNGFRALESGMAGFAMGGLLTPVGPKEMDSFWSAKFRHATSSAATFSTLTFTTNSLKFAGESMASSRPVLSGMLRNDAMAGLLSGIPAGLVSANSESILAGKGLANLKDNTKAALSLSLLGFGFGSVSGRFAPETKANQVNKNALQEPVTTVVVEPQVILTVNPDMAPKLTTAVTDAVSQRAVVGGGSDVVTRAVETPTVTTAQAVEATTTATRLKVDKPPRKLVVSDVTTDGVRLIIKSDGTKVTIQDGKTTIEAPGQKVVEPPLPVVEATKPVEGLRERHKPPDFSHLPEAERPLNVGGSNKELVAAEMSNFEHAPFVLDGRSFASVEAFYVWLKWSGHPEKQAKAQQMHGYEAKKFGKSSKATTAVYEGQEIVLGGPEHHALLKRAMQAKLEQHPDLARRFAQTHPRPIMHDLGYPENPGTRLRAEDFARLLTELRQDLLDGKVVTKHGPVRDLITRANKRKPG